MRCWRSIVQNCIDSDGQPKAGDEKIEMIVESLIRVEIRTNENQIEERRGKNERQLKA